MLNLIVRFMKWLLSLLQPATPEPPPPVEEKPLWDARLDTAGVVYQRRDGAYKLAAAWVTVNGNWDDVPAWAKRWQRDTLGGDHHAFGRVETASGDPVNAQFALIWGTGAEDGTVRMPEADGWANVPIYGGGGRYDWFPFGGDKLLGLNMPGNCHWSFFGVWTLRG